MITVTGFAAPMKLSRIAFFTVSCSAVALLGELRAQEPSAFEVFKTFCIDTGLDKSAIDAKAVSLGALPFNVPDDEMAIALANIAGIQKSGAAWLAKFGAHQFEVYFTSMDLAASSQGAEHSDNCLVIFRGDDNRAIEDFDRWIGISDSEAIKLPGMGEKIFEFEMIDGKHVPLPKTWRVDPTYSKRVTWTAEVMQWHGLSLSLERTQPF